MIPDDSNSTVILQQIVSDCRVDGIPRCVAGELAAVPTIRKWPIASRVRTWDYITNRSIRALTISDLSHELCEESARVEVKALALRRKGRIACPTGPLASAYADAVATFFLSSKTRASISRKVTKSRSAPAAPFGMLIKAALSPHLELSLNL